jgi:ADP-heptose:LPS heptosyltransferase
MNLQKIRRIAVIRNLHVGDVVCALPAFEALRQGMPHAHVTAVVSPNAAALLDNHPHVDDVLPDDFLEPPENLTATLQAGRFDAVLVTVPTKRNCRAAQRARVPIRVTSGWEWAAARSGTHRCFPPRKQLTFHEATYILAFTQRLGIPFTLADARPELHVDPALQTTIRERIVATIGSQGPLIAVHPGCRHSAYNWSVENYLETVRRLAARCRVIITGSHYDAKSLAWIESQLTPALRKRVMPITDLTLPGLIAALSLVDSFLSSSTGPLHIASIVSGHALGLYSEVLHMHPNRWRPIGPRGNVLTATWNYTELPEIGSALGERHMAQITVEMVVERMLAAVSRRREVNGR